jgi:RNA polymerase sigma factor (sigma-70 family)
MKRHQPTGAHQPLDTGTTNRTLVGRMLAGEEAAFEEFADTYLPALYRFALNRLDRDRELTREIVQSTVCKAIAKLGSFRGEAALMTWLCACCRAEIATHFRGKMRAPVQVELEDEVVAYETSLSQAHPFGPEETLSRKENAELVHIALDQLPPHYGKALEWKYLDNLSVKEIAERLSLRPKAAESLLTRARQSFRDRYGSLVESTRSPADRLQTGGGRMAPES